jgi:hypothetical protein
VNVAKMNVFAGVGLAVVRPTSSLERRLILKNLEKRRRVFSRQHMYRIMVIN